MSLTAQELSYLRDNHPHKLVPYLSILVPAVVYCGTVSGGPSKGDRDITVVDVSGTITNIEEGMTVLVGTSCGDNSISKRRFRSRAGQVLTLDENSVVWANGQYITVLENWELWPIFPFIDVDGNYTFYKDYDITYTDQNEEPPPVAIAGHHQAGFLDGADVSFPLDASDSYAVALGASIVAYLWECSSGTIANSTLAQTTITFNTPGYYWVKLTVTDDNGKTQVTRRVIFVHERSGDNAPFVDFSLENLEGNYSNGGWDTRIRVTGLADTSVIPDNALVVLWAETWYDGYKLDIGDNSNILFIGYIQEESIEKEIDIGQITFVASTIDKLLDKAKMFSVSLEYNSSPTTWYQYKNLTSTRAVHHLWKWHSTLFEITDVILPISADTKLTYAVDDFENGSLYSLVESFIYEHGIFAHVCCDKVDAVHVEIDVNVLNDADRAGIDVLFTMQDDDRRGDVDIEIVRDTLERTAYLTVSGTSYDGADATPYCAQAPGEAPLPFGSDAMFDRLVLEDQNEANYLAGKLLDIANREIVEMRHRFAGNYFQVMDIVPQRFVGVTITTADTKRGIEYSGNVVFRSLSVDISIEDGTLEMAGVAEPEIPDGTEGEFWRCVGDPTDIGDLSIDFPDPPTYTPFSFTPINFPPLIPPNYNLPSTPSQPSIASGPPLAVAMNKSNAGRSFNFNSSLPVWESIKPATSVGTFTRLSVSRLGRAAVLSETGGGTVFGKMFYTDDILATPIQWTEVLNDTIIQNQLTTQLITPAIFDLNLTHASNDLLCGIVSTPLGILDPQSENLYAIIIVQGQGAWASYLFALQFTSINKGAGWFVNWFEYPVGTILNNFIAQTQNKYWHLDRNGYYHGRKDNYLAGIGRFSGASATGILVTGHGPVVFQSIAGIHKVDPSGSDGLPGLYYAKGYDGSIYHTFDEGATVWVQTTDVNGDAVTGVRIGPNLGVQDDGSIYYNKDDGDIYYNHQLYITQENLYTDVNNRVPSPFPYRNIPGALGIVGLAPDTVPWNDEFIKWVYNGVAVNKSGNWTANIGTWGGATGSSFIEGNCMIEFPLTDEELAP